MALEFTKYESIQFVTLKDGTKVTVDEFEEQRGPIEWEKYLSMRARNAIANTFGDVDLNNKGYRELIANYNWLTVPNCGRKSYKEIMGLIEAYWPWQKRHGQGTKPRPRFHTTPKEIIDRNKKIYKDRLSGVSFKSLGEKYNLHPSTIRVICFKIEKYGDEYLKAHENND